MKKYDIYNYRYYFEDNPTRAMVRPGIILDQGVIIPIMKITGEEHWQRTPNDYILKDWDSEGLKKPSIARCDKIQPTSIKDIYQYKGHLSDDDIANIEQIMRGVNVEEQLCFTEAFDGTIYNEGALYEKFNRLFEAENAPTVIAFGRMNPPTIGHRKLVDTMASLTNGGKARLYLSHTQDKKKNPLSYEDKLHFAKEAFEPQIDVVESDARTIIEVLSELYNEGIKNIIYVGGEDRIGGKEDVSDLILRYNGQPDKQGNILYDFDSIQFKNAGARSADSDDLIERASASLARKYAQEGDFEHFKEIVPIEDADLLYKKVRGGLGLLNEELLTEAPFKTNEISKHDFKYLDKVSDDYVDNKEIKYINGETHRATEFNSEGELAEIDRELDSLKSLPSDADRVKEFNNITGLKWTKIYKGNYSGYSGDTAAGPGIGAEKDLLGDNKKAELLKLLKPYMEKKYGKVNNLELVNTVHSGGANSRRNVTLTNLFTVKDLYKDTTEGGSTGASIADVVYNVKVITDKGEYEEPIYLSVKEGPTVSPINLGINRVNSDTIISVLVDTISAEEKALMEKVLALRGTMYKGVALVKNDQSIDNWYYSLPSNELAVENYKNALVNSYGNNYFYYHVSGGKIIDFRPVSEIIDELNRETISDASLTITPARFVVQFSLGDLRCRLFFRRKGNTSMFLLSEVKRGARNIKFNGTHITDLAGYTFEFIE